jgi:N-acyl-D-aspartate/D-glutamate deacylase
MHDLVIRNGTLVDGTGRPRFTGDVAIDAGVIAGVGKVAQRGRREIDARHLLVTPGWVDVHTHYDGQVTWDPVLAPSSWHGVTTLVMGNCGVGFAPVRRGQEDFLIELMEGVEDIPGTALHEGIQWRWESFPEYMDALAQMPRVLDVAAQVPHCAIRAYVLGERAHELDLNDAEIAAMARLTQDAMCAGAVGFSTSRTILHRSRHGLVPGTHSKPEELLAIGSALGAAGHGVFEMVSDLQGQEPDLSWMVDFCRQTGRVITFALAQSPIQPHAWRETLARIDELAATGLRIVPQVPCRPTGMLYGLQSSLHPFITHPTYRTSWPICRCRSASHGCAIRQYGRGCSPRSRALTTRSPAS